ncbi:MAG: DUF1517 domain-containing protein [Deltaproteobacteria bacterium]|nr:DUF1517 domain-containing protein [Deltaproteobacteria bacterium]
MGKRWVLCALIVLFGSVAVADTGGSMGGGNWSSSSSSSSSYSGGGYSGGGYSSSSGWSSSDSSGGAGGAIDGVGLLIGFVIAILWLIFSGIAQVYRDNSGVNAPLSMGLGDYAPIDTVDVSVLRIAIDGRARKFVQNEIKNIASETDTSTADGRTAMLREVAILLRRLRDAWVYGGAVNEPMRDLGGAKPVFDRYVDDARSRFREETMRNEQGKKTTTAASSYTPHSDEGAGLILVSIIIAARRELFTVNRIGNGDDLRQALDSASQLTTSNLVAIEVVWQPSEDEDRLSSMELEAKYPRPDLIPIQGALVGKTFCAYCGGPYPAELVSCPHCGAPAAGKHAA